MMIKAKGFQWLCLICLLLLSLTSCASLKAGKHASASSFTFLNTYNAALRDYQAGKVMEARARVLAMDKEREDYPQAKKLLEETINPARIRLLRYYKAQAKKAERARRWVKAKNLYEQAAEFSTKPDIFLKYAKNMDINMRQKRMDILLKQRRLEDAIWVRWRQTYKPPRGIAPNDRAFRRMRENIEDNIEDRANQAYSDARYYLRHDMAGVAYIEAETYLRFMPNSRKGLHLMQEVKEAMPKGLKVARAKARHSKKSVAHQKSQQYKTYSKEDVQKFIKNGEWLKARHAAMAYRRNGGKDADKLLKAIDLKIEKVAADWFQKGSQAFRVEHIDQAVKDWSKAVSLQPENTEYVNALRRAKQLQEHLHLLRSDK